MGYASDFTADYSQLKADAAQFNECQANAAASIKNQIDSCKNVYELIALIYSSISPHIENQETPYGAAEKMQADIQRCNNDIHGMTNENSTSSALVTEVRADAKKMAAACSGTSASPAGSLEAEILAANGSTANQSLASNFKSIEDTIYTGSGTPPPDTIWAGTGIPASTDITTFAELQADMGTPGDPEGANHIYHTILTASNTNTSTLTTQTNVANTELKLLSSQDKQWLSFGNDIIQSFEGVMKAAQQHTQNAGG